MHIKYNNQNNSVLVSVIYITLLINYFLKEEFKAQRYTTIQIVNVLQWQTKKPLPLFFVDFKSD